MINKIFLNCYPLELLLKQPKAELLCNLKGGLLNEPI